MKKLLLFASCGVVVRVSTGVIIDLRLMFLLPFVLLDFKLWLCRTHEVKADKWVMSIECAHIVYSTEENVLISVTSFVKESYMPCRDIIYTLISIAIKALCGKLFVIVEWT